ncbi:MULTISPECIES: polysaccharide deacetylase family sporulation protein PdaB [Paenibacillus]|uniref:Polysaccharide deacetylase family sporulation protein PdaB n=1 Tax=Paenibacillus campinasensis TaxID=66347 RepID=A0A268EHH5_9BACL|nr:MULTISPECIES: polysaccharide deacetylase family sporulation protein PdaB [Paenibacillus]MUG68272.1 polysaccharide deacetylase family sporulation protein PdaB [Paenibacillus campinasensis]PAD72570.1 polysaccharide deacetylase family sporulation protein PdaB [Paenibacillus campinasensis]PAK49178.1 polysaccharide deacetylase family sporulation protein PdaB [Paenibacillus sp. 7541]
MNSFYVFNGKKIKRFFFVIAAAVFAIGVIYVESDNISVFSESTPSAIYSVTTDKKQIALTFDISWGEKRAEPILQVLKDNGVEKATFFLSAPWSKTHPDIVNAIKESGYEIGSHGYKHDNYSAMTDEEIRKQISTAHQILTSVTGQEPRLIRLPNGDFDKRVLSIAESLNYKVIQWDTDSRDWKNIGVDKIVHRVVSKAHPGDIVLMHASDSVKQTHEALPLIIEELRKQGYEFVTVTDLLEQSSAKGNEVRDQATIQKGIDDAVGM